MTFYFVVLGIIAAIGWTIVLLDWLARRKERQSHQRSAH